MPLSLFNPNLLLSALVAHSVITIDAVPSPDDPPPLKLLLLHNNDMHARFERTGPDSATCDGKNREQGRCVGGFARSVHEVRRQRRIYRERAGPDEDVIFLNAGDTFVGTAWFGVHRWRICAEFLNLLRPDAMSLGNHEFDNGVPGLAPLVANATFPILAANLDLALEPTLSPIKKSVVLNIKGRKVGVIGHVTPDTAIISSPGNVRFLPVVESIRDESELLRGMGVNIIIALGHSGYETDKEIAARVPLVDVVVGGHTNTFLWNGPRSAVVTETIDDVYPTVVTQKESGKRVPVVQAYAFTKYLGRLNLTFDHEGRLMEFEGQPLLMDSSVAEDGEALEMLERYRPEVAALNTKVVGKSRVVLEQTGNKCRYVECNFGNFIADAFVSYMTTLSTTLWTDTPIGLINGGTIRTTIDPTNTGGDITRGELLGAVPFSNQVVRIKLSGEDLLKSLEIGARSNGETSRGEFLQVSGMRVVYDMSRPSLARVVSVKVRCGQCQIPVYETLDLNKTYSVVTVNFLTNGGDGHHVLKENALRGQEVQDLGDIDVLEWYLGRYSPVYPEESGRISCVEKMTTDSGKSEGTLRRFILSNCTMVLLALIGRALM